MKSLTPADRRALRAKAHHLEPVVMIGNAGLTPAVLHEIDLNLLAHELIKIRVFSDERAQRDALLERICAELDAASVQHIGKLLVVFRKRPADKSRALKPKHRTPSASKQHKATGRKSRQPGDIAVNSPRAPRDDRRRQSAATPRPSSGRTRTGSRSR